MCSESMHSCNDSVCLKFCLFQSILAPAFHHGCPVRGMHGPTDSAANNIRKQLQQKYMLYLKRLCGVPSTTLHAVIVAELNMRSLKHFWWQQIMNFWNASASAPAFMILLLLTMGFSMVPTISHGQSLIALQCWFPFPYSSPKYSCDRCYSHGWT